MEQQTRGQLYVKQTSKIWRKNVYAFLTKCDFSVVAFYFDASCILLNAEESFLIC